MSSQWCFVNNYINERLANPTVDVMDIIPTVPADHYELFGGALKVQCYTILGKLIRQYTLDAFDTCGDYGDAVEASFPNLDEHEREEVMRCIISGNDEALGKIAYREIEKELSSQGSELYEEDKPLIWDTKEFIG